MPRVTQTGAEQASGDHQKSPLPTLRVVAFPNQRGIFGAVVDERVDHGLVLFYFTTIVVKKGQN
jgi:hypothetical protein